MRRRVYRESADNDAFIANQPIMRLPRDLTPFSSRRMVGSEAAEVHAGGPDGGVHSFVSLQEIGGIDAPGTVIVGESNGQG